MITTSEFGSTKCPLPLMADAYTISSNSFASQSAKDKSVYNTVNRRSPKEAWPEVANDSRNVFYGITEYIRSYLVNPITQNDIDESALFMERYGSFGTGLYFAKDMWESVLNDYDGFLPIKVRAVKEGSVFFPNEPYIQVISSDNGFGELAAHVEAVMLGMCSIATARLTLTRHWLQQMLDWTRRGASIDDERAIQATAQWMIHDFGMRAHSCEHESRVLGKAHLLCFNGTDSTNAAYSAWKEGCHPQTGTSIHALAHRNVQGYEQHGELGEGMSFRAIHGASKNYGNIASYVSDCYNFKKAVEKCAQIASAGDGIVVSRPDSGNAIDNIVYIINTAIQHKLFNGKNATKLRFIEGNSVNPTITKKVFEVIEGMDLNPMGWGIFGVGGFLRNSCTRDILSSKYALSAIGHKYHGVCKLSEDEIKISVPGPNNLCRPVNGQSKTVFLSDELTDDTRTHTYYDDGNIDFNVMKEPFSAKQDRTVADFNFFSAFSQENPDFGLDCNHLSSKILGIRKETARKYKYV